MDIFWNKVTEDFLSYTVECFSDEYDEDDNLTNTTKKFNTFSAHIVANGLLFLLPDSINCDKVLIISAGIHGNETAPLELLQQWAKDIFSGKQKISIPLVLIIGNPPAIIKSTRFIRENLNRLFSLNEPSTEVHFEAQRADEIMKQLLRLKNKFNWNEVVHFDLHTAIRKSKEERFLVLPYKKDNSHSKTLIDFWANCGLTAALRANKPAKTFSYFSQSQLNAVSATVELGKVAPFGENDMTLLTGVDKGIREFLNYGTWPVVERKTRLKVFQVKQELIKTGSDFKLYIEDGFANFSSFPANYLLAEDKSEGFEYRTSSTKEVLVFPNNKVPVGERVGLVAELESD